MAPTRTQHGDSGEQPCQSERSSMQEILGLDKEAFEAFKVTINNLMKEVYDVTRLRSEQAEETEMFMAKLLAAYPHVLDESEDSKLRVVHQYISKSYGAWRFQHVHRNKLSYKANKSSGKTSKKTPKRTRTSSLLLHSMPPVTPALPCRKSQFKSAYGEHEVTLARTTEYGQSQALTNLAGYASSMSADDDNVSTSSSSAGLSSNASSNGHALPPSSLDEPQYSPLPGTTDPPRQNDIFTTYSGSQDADYEGIRFFLNECEPSMERYLARFLNLGCTNLRYLRTLSVVQEGERDEFILRLGNMYQPEACSSTGSSRDDDLTPMDFLVLKHGLRIFASKYF